MKLSSLHVGTRTEGPRSSPGRPSPDTLVNYHSLVISHIGVYGGPIKVLWGIKAGRFGFVVLICGVISHGPRRPASFHELEVI